MGMYTQGRGWLNVNSIGNDKRNDRIQQVFDEMKQNFIGNGRDWIAEDLTLNFGSNGSAWIFLGTELKNYNNEIESLIRHVISYFPNAEGRFDIQHEKVDPNIQDNGYDFYMEPDYYLIYKGSIVESGTCRPWCHGYGNMY